MGAARLSRITVKLPGLEGELVADDDQRRAAWEIYVELVTRVAVVPLGAGEGLLREALSSFHALFGEARRILRAYGPDVAIPEKKGRLAVGHVVVDLLNHTIRPLVATWHPLLLAHEATRAPGASPVEHERAWTRAAELRAVLERARREVLPYADLLATIAGVSGLHPSSDEAP